MANDLSLDVVNQVFEMFQNNANTLIERLQPTCLKVMFSLMVIDLIIDLLFDQGDENIFLILIRKVMLYGLFITVVQQYKVIVNDYVLKGFIQLGNYLSLGKLGTSFEFAPTQVISDFLIWVTPLWSAGGIFMAVLDKLGIESIPTGLCLLSLWAIGLYAFITCTVTMAFVRFFIISSCALLIVPFAVFKETASIGRGILQVLLKQGAKIMLMVMILNFMATSTEFKGDISFTSLTGVIIGALVWYTIIHEVPSLVDEMFGGHLGGAFGRGGGIMGVAQKQTIQSVNNIGSGVGQSLGQNLKLAGHNISSKIREIGRKK
ncbi:type IV secretion system protein [uncultured Fusobacterium sp.]|uniref:type IV secretion system protein n=1 Tax=uncultured Fusobacterium sp. TaxID=159267 RepID=UPI0015A52245|nr:type IV secretion system protein [uncultured Fusobacterium sp.]